MYIEDYSDKSFVVFGLTCKEEFDKLATAGGLKHDALLSKKENKRLPGFVFPKYKFKREDLDRLIQLLNSNIPKNPTPLDPPAKKTSTPVQISAMKTESSTKEVITSLASTSISAKSAPSVSNDSTEDLRAMMSLFLQRQEVLEAEVRTLKNIVMKGDFSSGEKNKKRSSPVRLPATGGRKKTVTIKEPVVDLEAEPDDMDDEEDTQSTSFYLQHLKD
jgi:hypothetical protein